MKPLALISRNTAKALTTTRRIAFTLSPESALLGRARASADRIAIERWAGDGLDDRTSAVGRLVLVGGEPGIGAEYDVTTRFAGRTMVLRYRTTAHEAPHLFVVEATLLKRLEKATDKSRVQKALRMLKAEQSNSSVAYGDQLLLKLFKITYITNIGAGKTVVIGKYF